MLGAGNVSTHISRHLHSKGHRISCVYSRNMESASVLAEQLGAKATTRPEEVPGQADFFLLCLPDKAVAEVAGRFKGREGIWLHTAGALSMDLFRDLFPRYGVFYPLQTLTKSQEIALASSPFLVEGSSPEVESAIAELARSISNRVEAMDSGQRRIVHLAAVFANNFTNHMLRIGQEILTENQLDTTLLDPILEETVRKAALMGASRAQTGPAQRDDQESMQKHLELLRSHPGWQNLYTFISRDIGSSRDQ